MKAAEVSKQQQLNQISTTGVPKNFRQQADIEAFYRFIYENDLREEALTILDEVRNLKTLARMQAKKTKH